MRRSAPAFSAIPAALLGLALALPLSHPVLAQAFPPGFVHPRPTPEPAPYTGPLRPGEAVPGWYAVRDTEWEVTPDIVEHVQALIDEQAKRPLDNFRIQYRGLIQHRHRIVFISGYCRSFDMSVQDLIEDRRVVMDGGTCFFNGWYDADEQRFEAFHFHGQR